MGDHELRDCVHIQGSGVDFCWTGRGACISAHRQLGWSFLGDDRMRPHGGNSGIVLAEAGCSTHYSASGGDGPGWAGAWDASRVRFGKLTSEGLAKSLV